MVNILNELISLLTESINFTEKDHQTRFFVSFSSMEKEKKYKNEF
jgi:hypothetical protein